MNKVSILISLTYSNMRLPTVVSISRSPKNVKKQALPAHATSITLIIYEAPSQHRHSAPIAAKAMIAI